MLVPMVAGGDIMPHRFVIQSTAADHKCLQAGANGLVIGVSQRGTRNTPMDGLDDGKAAVAGESVHIYGAGETCLLELGGTVAAGDRLKSDANGKGVTATVGSGDNYGAFAGEAGTAGKLIEVQVQVGTWGEA
jgi:hypothetical protein